MAWTKEVHRSRLQAKRETAAKKRHGEPVSYGQNSGLAPAALVACVLFKVVPGEACGASAMAFLLETPHSHALLPAAWLRNRHRIEKEGIRVSPTISLPCTASQNTFPRLSMLRFAIAGAAFC